MKKVLMSTLIICLMFIIGACGQDVDSTNNDTLTEESATNKENESSKTGTNYPLTIKDATGEEIIFESAPKRIVSTSPSETEILFALGLEDEIVGVSDYDDYPESALSKPKMGGIVDPNAEAIIAAEPDLVIGGMSMNDDITEKLRGLDLPIYKTNPQHLEDILENIKQIGIITDSQEAADKLINKMKEDIKRIEDMAADIPDEDRKKVYLEFSPGWTVGEGEYMHELVTLTGSINIAADTEGWNEINEEKIIQANPDVIIYADNLVDEDSGKQLSELIKTRSGWDKITAIQEDQMVGVDQNLMNRLGPRVTEALEIIAESIYPELYKE